jgi:hypothetical protein
MLNKMKEIKDKLPEQYPEINLLKQKLYPDYPDNVTKPSECQLEEEHVFPRSEYLKYFYSASDFNEFLDSPYCKTQLLLEHSINEGLKTDRSGWAETDNFSRKFPGYCWVCNKISFFSVDFLSSDGENINFRERLVCESCNLNSRQRFIMGFIMQQYKIRSVRSIYIQEQVTHFYSILKNILQDVSVTGSEFLGNNLIPGQNINGIRHEDSMNLSFDNDSFDIIVSNDVLEHVPDIDSALSEIYRTLKPGGKFIFTVPYYYNKTNTVKRALYKDGQISYNEPPVFHGNPVSPEGSLVIYDYGQDIFQYSKNGGFDKTYIVYGLGFFARPFLFCAEKTTFVN